MNESLCKRVVELAEEAGRAILTVYHSGSFDVSRKADASPLTEADLLSHSIIEKGLRSLTPDAPVLSEESVGIEVATRRAWGTFWLVDPLDGTKEFIKRNGEFTVNIALIEDGCPVFGVVVAPVLERTYFGGVETPSVRIDTDGTHSISCCPRRRPLKIVSSRSHPSPEQEAFLNSLGPHECIPMGSSLKICLVAEGTADFYPRLGPTMEWDIAAAHAVVLGAGGQLTQLEGEAVKYNKLDLLNPHFLVSNGEPLS